MSRMNLPSSVLIQLLAYRLPGWNLQIGAAKSGNARADRGRQIGLGCRLGNCVSEDLAGLFFHGR